MLIIHFIPVIGCQDECFTSRLGMGGCATSVEGQLNSCCAWEFQGRCVNSCPQPYFVIAPGYVCLERGSNYYVLYS